MSTKLKEVTKITQVIQRDDGSEVKIVAEAFFGAGLHQSIDVYVHKRESANHDWILCSDRPHPDWRSMSVEDYDKHGRSSMLQAVSSGELLKAMNAIGAPMSQYEIPASSNDGQSDMCNQETTPGDEFEIAPTNG